MRYRFLIFALAAVCVLAAGYGVFWWRAAEELSGGVDGWARQRRAEGWHVNYGAVRVDGFPFRLELSVDEPRLSQERRDLLWRWRTSVLKAGARPWRIDRIAVQLPRPLTLIIRDRGREILLTGTSGRGNALLSGKGELRAGRMLLDDVRATVSQGGQTGTISAAAASVDVRPDKVVRLQLRNLVLPAHFSMPFGREVSGLVLEGRLVGAIEGVGRLRDRLTKWRDSGGRVELRNVQLDWPPVALRGGGALSLDGNLQPAGHVDARLSGYQEAIAILVRAGHVSPGDGSRARVIMGLMARRPPDGGPPEVAAPFRLSQGWLTVGPLPLVRLPAVSWSPGCRPGAPAGCAARLR